MKRLFWITLVVTILCISPLSAEETAFDLEKLKIEHKTFVLDNGLTLIVHTDHSVPIVAVNTWYHVGSRNEMRGRTGFAHLFEHFFFNGSENHPFGFREAMDDIGANNRNGTTNTDRTNFFEDVPVSALERTLFLESDRMGFLGGYINQEMLERERGVVQNEKRQGENRPYGRVFGRIVESIFPYSHPYSWSTIGRMEDLDAATLDDIKDWYKSYYGPNNCVLSLAGDITPERALELVSKYFGAIPPSPPIDRYETWIPKLEANLRDEMQDRVPQARIYRVYHLGPWGEVETHRMELFASVLSGSKSAPLDRRLVFDKQLATDVGAFVWDKELVSNLILTITVKPGVDPREAEKEMDAVVAELLKRGPTAAELQRAKTRFVSSYTRGIERLGGFGGRSDVLAESATYGGSTDAYLERLENLTTSTPEDVASASRMWLNDAHHYTMTVLPYPTMAASKTDVDRSTVPGLDEAPDVKFPEVQRTTLKNGLQVLLVERHTTPLVNMTLAVDAGYSSDPEGKAGIASFALGLMEEGTKTRDAFKIADELDALGASISTGSSLDLSLVRLRALKMNLAGSLDVFADVALNPSFPDDMLEISRKRTLASIGQEKANPRAMAFRIIPRLLYGEGHGYGNPATGSGYEAAVEALTKADLAGWHAEWFLPNNATLVVAGDTMLKELVPRLEKAFGSWKSGDKSAKKVGTATSPSKGKVFVIDKPGAPQSVIVAAHLSQPGGQPEDLAIETVMRNFGGMSTSRLNRNLRLDKHWSYGSQGFVLDARGQRPFMVIAPVQSDKTKEAMAEVRMEIEGVAGARPVKGEEYASIMRNMVLRLPGRFETLSALEGAALDVVSFGYPAEYYYDYAKNVKALSEADLAKASAKFVTPGELTWLVVGDLASVEAGIRDLGYGEVVRLDPDGMVVK